MAGRYADLDERIDRLDELSRTRALTNEESIELGKLIAAERQRVLRGAKLRVFWRPREDETMRDLRQAGYSWPAIAARLGRSLGAVQRRRFYLDRRVASVEEVG